ncbi:MAG: 4-(cytidine 5'-diphospho)-2-C-methyl-D-erythritol kinase [Alphaproteobacteria bacterium]|nr:4-(cytidine 5'-diphospho)-2-C-methyl-D-erythritol kinase [Alphaproteobacteria bacterium]
MPYSLIANETAYAKINLALQLVVQLPNGYHQLDSVVGFIDIGDHLQASAEMDGTIRLAIEGIYSEGLCSENNLVIRAAQCLQQHANLSVGAHIRLTKNIPVGAGLGGGSADAAASLRLLNRVWNLRYSTAMLAEISEELGADVPACVFSQSTRMEGVGEQLSPLPHVPALPIAVVYPNIPLWTPDVYTALHGKGFSGRLSNIPAIGATSKQWLDWLHAHANDLEAPAMQLNNQIIAMLKQLASTQGCVLSRMSGSGSACFGVFENAHSAELAAQEIQTAQPKWWVRSSHILGM